MSGTPSAIVVGAGVVGAACAEALATAGCAVTVLDVAFPGAGATGAAMGHVVVMDDSPAQLALTSWSRRLWAERVEAATAPDRAALEHERCGTLWVAADDEELAGVRQKAGVYAAQGDEAVVLDAAGLRSEEPALRPGLAGGLLVPGDRVVYPPAAARLFLDGARQLGARLRLAARVEAVAPGRALCAGRWLEADLVVVAAGCDSVRLLEGLPILPRKGHLVVSERYPGLVRHQVVELGYLKSAHALTRESVAFNVQPRRTGQLLIGSSRELVDRDAALNRPLVARMLRRAIDFMPALASVRALRTWTGFRPATPDGLPLIGPWEAGLLVAAGHEGLGITTAPATAHLIADLALGRAPALDPAPFHPRRSLPAHE